MKILYYIKEYQTPMYQWQRVHIFDELERHDCHITVFNPLQYATIDEANEKLVSFINNDTFDLFMTPCGSDDLFIETLLQIKQKGLPTLLICFDNLIIPYNHKDIAKHFDIVWLTSNETEGMFKRWGANTLFNPYAANPYYFKPNYISEIERISFIGTPYGSRVNMINLLIKGEVNISLYSNMTTNNQDFSGNKPILEYIKPAYDLMRFNIGRKVMLGAMKQKILGTSKVDTDNEYLEMKPSVELEQLSELYSNYALSLASTAARNTGVLRKPVNIVNLRSFEIPMSGGLQICSYFDELAGYFEEDKEIIFYKSDDELIEKVNFYLKPENEKVRMKIKQAARRRAEKDHTWFCRFKKAFDYLGLEYK